MKKDCGACDRIEEFMKELRDCEMWQEGSRYNREGLREELEFTVYAAKEFVRKWTGAIPSVCGDCLRCLGTCPTCNRSMNR